MSSAEYLRYVPSVQTPISIMATKRSSFEDVNDESARPRYPDDTGSWCTADSSQIDDDVRSSSRLSGELTAEGVILNSATVWRDHALAARLGTVIGERSRTPSPPGFASLQYIRTLRNDRHEGDTASIVVNAAASRGIFEPIESHVTEEHACVVCTDPVGDTGIRVRCGHYYDPECMLELIKAAVRDESLFPPRCCGVKIPLKSAKPHIDAELSLLLKLKAREVRVLKRVYCARPSCSRFLGKQIQSRFLHFFAPQYTCRAPGCGTKTCTRCKSQAGKGHRCEPDVQEHGVLDLAREKEWARCPGCKHLVELNTGCYHMTCRCKTEFCYLCKAKWRKCACTLWAPRDD
ncbi:uncharacterized protein LAESUDRAFT_694447 [Laetiporus sulphureus 93-53]|uniref:RBR-type E3 ubiquitin transferase n=1 Tax=Laetiporus sulphureus 93-53 TaxID=1314785 RepID=A0A165G7F8_9APHY|nr:uncharacterized protein LAESUDRAFT_694447 [Laetiporus sulphureus 93-53]KZT09933.1 hypothetical protein LAESUDRAFT_694447 [Laetiporus sulphureus 93-53]